ncbi:hypothetical protein [Variovorax sp. CF313]|uniref:hypothetical protein n=1 Tax=Variovorax sp. CF313 TaxID=1144315 RepID=UPI00138AFFC2|nr:hypothetical protein [Variovorax sp. CF313]
MSLLLSPRQADVVGYVALTMGEGHVQRSIGAVDQADVAKAIVQRRSPASASRLPWGAEARKKYGRRLPC